MDKNKKPEQDDPAQSKRFVETAKELGVDESGKELDKALKKVIPKKPLNRSAQKP